MSESSVLIPSNKDLATPALPILTMNSYLSNMMFFWSRSSLKFMSDHLAEFMELLPTLVEIDTPSSDILGSPSFVPVLYTELLTTAVDIYGYKY